MHDQSSEPTPSSLDPFFRHNLCVESFFSAFNGIFMGLAIFVSPIVAVVALEASPLEVTVLATAFPVGAFLGPLWAYLGRRWGTQRLVIVSSVLGNFCFLLLFWVEHAVHFTVLLSISQLLNSAMRMGQSNLYRLTYPKEKRGRVLGRLTFWTYVTMVPSVLMMGLLLDRSREIYQVVYPMAGICGLIGCFYYGLIRVPKAVADRGTKLSLRRGVQNVEQVLRDDKLYLLFQIGFFLTGGSLFLSRHVVLLLTKERFGFGAFELSLCLSVIPQIMLAVGSPLWGRVLDRIGIMRCRVLISSLLSLCLLLYFFGIVFERSWLIYLASFLLGFSNAGGQLTWFLASSLFAPRNEDVPLYNGIHFVLNGTRGLVLPWVGSILFVLTGPGALLASAGFSLGSLPVLLRALRLKDERLDHKPLRFLPSEPKEEGPTVERATRPTPSPKNGSLTTTTSG
ncbi:MAG: MFS transporter [Gemmataceae bacterium]